MDFAVSAGKNWEDSVVVCSEVPPYQIVDSVHLVACFRMHFVNHVTVVAVVVAVVAAVVV